MQPFSHSFLQGLLAGHSLPVHSHSYGTMLNGNLRLLCSAMMPRTTAMQSPLPGFSEAWRAADLAGNSHLLLRSASAPRAGGGRTIPGGFRWTKRWPARPSTGHGPMLSGRLDCGSPEAPSDQHFYASIVYSPLAPSKANAAAKPASIPAAGSVTPRSVLVSAVSQVSTQLSSSFKKPPSVGVSSQHQVKPHSTQMLLRLFSCKSVLNFDLPYLLDFVSRKPNRTKQPLTNPPMLS